MNFCAFLFDRIKLLTIMFDSHIIYLC